MNRLHSSNRNPPPASRNRLVPDYDSMDRGACGIGFVADRYGRPSHALLNLGLQALINLQHRGALNADGVTGDGAGILTSLPKPFFAREAEQLTGHPVDADTLAVATLFLYPETIDDCHAVFEIALAAAGLHLIGWRSVPTDSSTLGQYARDTQPFITQALIEHPKGMSAAEVERRLFITRKRFDRDANGLSLAAYVVSCSSQTIVYKGLLLAPQLSAFYADLRHPDFAPHLVLFHQRYSTNTLPAWHRAQPFRVLCHNGEINTIQGNIAWMASREADLQLDSPDYHLRADDLHPIIDLDGSDSAMLDNAAELLTRAGRDIRHSLSMLIPSAWEQTADQPQSVRDFYRYHAAIAEPWDGPAAIVFSDGRYVGAALDRNGLRPLRYIICDDGLIGAASEVGAINIRAKHILAKERLGPGQMFAVDTATGKLLDDHHLKLHLATLKPYGQWLSENLRPLTNRAFPLHPNHPTHLTTHQAAFGYTAEELVVVLRPMVENRAEAVGSMGDDTPAAILSPKPRPLYSYFRQRFAEVTNPPIDYLRETHVMSLRVRLGHRPNLLTETPEHAKVVELESPFIIDAALAHLRNDPDLRATTLSTLVDAAVCSRPGGLAHALRLLCARAESAARSGSRLIILSDVNVDPKRTFIPSLLAASAVHHDLLNAGLRGRVSLVVESGEPRDVHHLACLLAYGANAVHPYLALATAASLASGGLTPARAMRNYLHAAEHGLFKIMSKMGITTVDSYTGAQIFEVVGLSNAVIARYFEGTPAHVGGLDLDDIGKIVIAWHRRAFFRDNVSLASPGYYKFKRDGETHAFSPEVVRALHEAVEADDYGEYKKYSALVHSRPPVDFRDLLDFAVGAPREAPLPAMGVEPASSIIRRFSTAAMSHGALSKEAHETMSVAMNRLGSFSNSGEGGEESSRYHNQRNDRIKQVASGRFGVTASYLVNADELQIKMAQGAKPGEGGQLPSHKVTAEIAALRFAQPGMILISPPPHHDIYSIEDLAQLIYDLRQINPRAAISVKLVAQAGVGTIAAGVAKAGADVILISGHNGGTGASPLSSVKYAGVAWELGLADAQHALVNSGLRGRVRLRVDGGLRTGRDVVIAALLGADEFSFGTVAAVAIGCVMARACHLNTCPAGIATQDPKLRAKFHTPPDHLMSFMKFVAEEARGILASIGLSSMQEAVGRVDLLKQVSPGLPGNPPVDLTRLTTLPDAEGPRSYVGQPNPLVGSAPLNRTLLVEAVSAIETRDPVELHYPITNRTRAFGALVASAVAKRYGDAGLPPHTIVVRARGSAGQSFGAFAVRGMHMHLQGEANDYVGKGLTGGEIVIKPSPDYHGEHPVLAGNAILYGATGGSLFIAGRVGERFAVRNSGAAAVVEGVGDHGCEYMTGGAVVVLGPIGRNFGAGMSGGVAVLQIADFGLRIADCINASMVRIDSVADEDAEWLRGMIARHAQLTDSARAKHILAHFDPSQFIKVAPRGEPLKEPLRPEVVAVPEPAVA
ncbi:MAG: glutamate synthase large subunit [Chloroflexi bacterium]|nr:glutamate synthase large subunit [Chloroflexota bacterium]